MARLLPLDKLSNDDRKRVALVTEGATFEVSIGPRQINGDQRIFEYQLDHLEVCAIAGRCLRVGNYESRREKDGRLFGDDGEGATGYLTFVHRADGKRVFFVEGTQKGVFTVGGHSVGVLDYGSVSRPKKEIDYNLHLWVRVDNRFFAFLSRIFLSKSQRVATRQFSKMLSIPLGVTQKVEDDPRAVIDAFDELGVREREAVKDFRSLILKLEH